MPTNPESLLVRLKEFIRKHWNPKPIDPPKPDSDLGNMNGAQRSAETIRYSILSFEYWLSPLGRLREWVRLNSKLCMILLIPGVLVLPLVSWIIYLVAGWALMLVSLAGNLILLPVIVLVAAMCIAGVLSVLRTMFH